MSATTITYTPSKTGVAFHNDNSRIRAIMGPIGSGKSTACVLEILKRASEQAPDERGRRRTRALIVRNTFGELKSTTIKTCERWWAGLGKFIYDSPIRFECERTMPDGTVLDFEAVFLPLDRPDQVGKLRSLEVTFAWINEAALVPSIALQVINGRIGRYPETVRDAQGRVVYGPTWRGVFLDTNPCGEKHWFHDLFVKRKGVDEFIKVAEKEAANDNRQPIGFTLHRQPGGLMRVELEDGTITYEPDPDAENIDFIDGGYGYYLNQLPGATEEYIATMLCGKFATAFDGKPVYPQYKDTEHCASEPLRFAKAVPLVIGFDFGLNPAAAFTQMDATGTMMVVDELCGFDVTFDDFLNDMFMPRLLERYRDAQVRVIGDPSGANRNALSLKTVYELLADRGINAVPAPTNDFIMRRDAVAHYLSRRRGLLLSPHCEYLRDGFKGGYKYPALKGSIAAFKREPDKNEYSHIHDGLQYAALYYYRGVVRPARQRVRHVQAADQQTRKRFAYA